MAPHFFAVCLCVWAAKRTYFASIHATDWAMKLKVYKRATEQHTTGIASVNVYIHEPRGIFVLIILWNRHLDLRRISSNFYVQKQNRAKQSKVNAHHIWWMVEWLHCFIVLPSTMCQHIPKTICKRLFSHSRWQQSRKRTTLIPFNIHYTQRNATQEC